MNIGSELASLALLPCLLGNMHEIQSASGLVQSVHEATPATLESPDSPHWGWSKVILKTREWRSMRVYISKCGEVDSCPRKKEPKSILLTGWIYLMMSAPGIAVLQFLFLSLFWVPMPGMDCCCLLLRPHVTWTWSLVKINVRTQQDNCSAQLRKLLSLASPGLAFIPMRHLVCLSIELLMTFH